MRLLSPFLKKLILVALFGFFLFFQFYSIATSYITSDNALVGLAAQNILKGERPVFTYGQSFMGTIEAYLVAILFYFFGSSGFLLQLVPVFFAVGFLVVLYRLAAGLLGEAGAVLAVYLMVLGPGYFQGFAHAARGGYIETLCFGTAFFWLVYLIVWDKRKSQNLVLKYGCLGLVAGLGCWTNILIISYLAVGAFFILLNDKKIFFKKYSWLALAGFFIGSAPFWVFNIVHPLASFGSMSKASGNFSPGLLLLNFKNIFFNQLPELFNLNQNGFWEWPARLIYWFFFFIYAGLIFQRRRGLFKIMRGNLSESTGLEMLLLFMPLVLLICIVSRFGSFDVPRYLLPVYTAYPLLLAVFVAKNWSRYRVPLAVLLAFILFFNISNILTRLSPELVRKNLANEASNFVLIDFFKKNSIDKFYSDYWISYRLTFLSRQSVIGSSLGRQPQENYGLAVNSSKNPAFVFDGPVFFDEALAAAGGSFKKEILTFPSSDQDVGNYSVFYDFRPPVQGQREIMPAGFKVLASENQKDTPGIFDRNISTFWGTAGNLTPGDYLLVDLKRPVNLSRVDWLGAAFSKMLPGTMGGFQILVSADGNKWLKVSEIKEVVAPLFWSGPHPFFREENGRISFTFHPTEVRYLKILQTKKSQRNPWIVRELFLYEPTGAWPNPGWETAALMKFLKEKNARFVVADYWLSSFINYSTTGQIGTLKQLNETSYREKIKTKDNPRVFEITPAVFFVIKPDESAALEAVLNKIAAGYQKQSVSGWLVYYGLNPKTGAERRYFWNGTHLL